MKKLVFAFSLVAAACVPRMAFAQPCAVAHSFVTGETLTQANLNANPTQFSNCFNQIDNTNIGTNGIYASQIIPSTTLNATFGGSVPYTFSQAPRFGSALSVTSGGTGTITGAINGVGIGSDTSGINPHTNGQPGLYVSGGAIGLDSIGAASVALGYNNPSTTQVEFGPTGLWGAVNSGGAYFPYTESVIAGTMYANGSGTNIHIQRAGFDLGFEVGAGYPSSTYPLDSIGLYDNQHSQPTGWYVTSGGFENNSGMGSLGPITSSTTISGNQLTSTTNIIANSGGSASEVLPAWINGSAFIASTNAHLEASLVTPSSSSQTITFTKPFDTSPICVVTPSNGGAFPSAIPTSTSLALSGMSTGGFSYPYICVGN